MSVNKFALLALVSVLILAACGPAPVPPTGQVYTIQTGTTLYWVEQAMKGVTGTHILQNKAGDIVVMWNMQGQGMGFTLITKSPTAVEEWYKVTGGRANLANYTDAGQLRDFLKDNGWKVVAAKELTKAVKYNILLNVKLIAARLSGTLVGIGVYVIPAELQWNTILLDGVEIHDA
jgi:GNAT superfamily N-acetyltransferase